MFKIKDTIHSSRRYIDEFEHGRFIKSSKRIVKAIKDSCIRHKKGIFRVANVVAPACAIVVLVFTINFFNGRSYALVLDYNGQTLGAVSNEQELGQVVTDINQDLSCEAIETQNVSITPQYVVAHISNNSTQDANEIKDKIIKTSDSNIQQGTGLYVNNQLIGFIDDDDSTTLSNELNNKLSSYDTDDNTTVGFYDNVSVKDGIYPNSSYKSTNDMISTLNSTKLIDVTYTSKEGDTINSIAEANGVTSDSIKATNADIESKFTPDNTSTAENSTNDTNVDINTKNIVPGTTLIIEEEVPFLPVKITTMQNYTASVPFETENQPNDNEYVGYTKVLQQGINGTADCTDSVTTVNGIEIGRTSLNKVTTSEPVKQIAEVGTKKLPSTTQYAEPDGVLTGSFMWPVPDCSVISSPFGDTDGRSTPHSGIDIAGGSGGQTIVAADGGTVVQASDKNNGYGNCVIIEHNGEFKTLYGHCASLLVSVGDTVTKGQPIATVGSTGYSTGPHLHFEIQINGTAVNPEPFIRTSEE